MREIVVDNFAGGGGASTGIDGAGAGKPAGAVPGEEERMTQRTVPLILEVAGWNR